MKTSNTFIGSGVEKLATGCSGSSSYKDFAEQKGYKYIEVLNWTSSAGDWQFIISKNGKEWQILSQTNNYPKTGFSHEIDSQVFCGTAKQALKAIIKRYY